MFPREGEAPNCDVGGAEPLGCGGAEEVFAAAGLYQKGSKLEVDPPLFDIAPREYNVQYHETDLAFVSRLMEDDGIFFFFEHEADKHVLVLADHPGAHKPLPGSPASGSTRRPGRSSGSGRRAAHHPAVRSGRSPAPRSATPARAAGTATATRRSVTTCPSRRCR